MYIKNNDFHKFNLVNIWTKVRRNLKIISVYNNLLRVTNLGSYKSNTYTKKTQKYIHKKKTNHKKNFLKKPIKQTNKQINKWTKQKTGRKEHLRVHQTISFEFPYNSHHSKRYFLWTVFPGREKSEFLRAGERDSGPTSAPGI